MNTPFIHIEAPRRLTIRISNAWARCYFRLLAVWLVVYTIQTLAELAKVHP